MVKDKMFKVYVHLGFVLTSLMFVVLMFMFNLVVVNDKSVEVSYTYVIDTKQTICENYNLYTYNTTHCSNQPIRKPLININI